MILAAALLVFAPAADHAAAKRLLDRSGACAHWAGEVDGGPGVSRARQRQVLRGLEANRCGDELTHDLKAFLRTHPRPADARAVRKALADQG